MRTLRVAIAVLAVPVVVAGSALIGPGEAHAATKTIGDCDIIMKSRTHRGIIGEMFRLTRVSTARPLSATLVSAQS